jgi:hypothetical protein
MGCGQWGSFPDYCEPCMQRNAMNVIKPSAPPMQQQQQQQQQLPYQHPQYTYAVPYQQQQMYSYYQARPSYQPPYQPPQQQQMGTGTAMLAGFVIGAVAEDILDPMD